MNALMLMKAALLADVTGWPYHSGNGLVDFLLFVVFCFVAGWAFGLGWRVAAKFP